MKRALFAIASVAIATAVGAEAANADVSFLVTKALGATPGLSFGLCVSAGTEPGGKLLR